MDYNGYKNNSMVKENFKMSQNVKTDQKYSKDVIKVNILIQQCSTN